MDLLESIVVGTEGCTIEKIVDVFLNDVNSALVFHNWRDFARELRISSCQIEEWRLDRQLDKLSVKDILHKILILWRCLNGNNATLPALIKHLEKAKLKNIGDDIKELFSKENRINKIAAIFKPNLPQKPNYYITRTLITRRVINVRAFSSTDKDVFVLHGDEIDRHRLSKLAGKELTDTSTEQVRKHELSVRFILLQHFGDWALLCGKTTNPIHLLTHHEGRFQWICTKGDISALQKTSDEKNQNKLSEEEFIEEVETELQFQPNQPVCLSDSPGMGKSMLLANIGRQLQQKYPQKFIAFIVISEFTVKIRALLPKFGSTKKAVQEALLQTLCENIAAREFFHKITTPAENPSTQVELMFDGLDEVSNENLDLAYDCLEILKTNFSSSTRVWVTTRPQHLYKLEKRLSVLGYKIQAFQEKHQIDFLTSFWKSDGKNLDGDKLQSFSNDCISTLKKKLDKKDEDIAGIPLQCKMIGEVYLEDAHRFADSKNKNIPNCTLAVPSININSIADLYEKMIAYKIEKFIGTYPLQAGEIRNIWLLHMYLALELIFPSHVHEFKESLQIGPEVKPAYLVNIGILERRGGTTEDPARFIHRTFAEYLAARYFVLYVITGQTNVSTDFQIASRVLPNFLFEHLLGCWTSFIWPAGLKFSFRHSVLCHFLNGLLGLQAQISTENCASIKSHKFLQNVLYACIHSDFGNILRFLRGLKYPKNYYINDIFYHDSNILIDATTLASLDLLKFILQNFKHKPLTAIHAENLWETPLHAAVSRGSYTIFEYILKQHDFEELIKEDKRFLDLIYCAVQDTTGCNPDEIKDRVQILTALCELNKELVNFTGNRSGQSPLLADGVNIVLMKKLIGCGANLFHINDTNNTFLHRAVSFLSATEYYDLLQCISNTYLNSLLQMQNSNGDLSFHLIVKNGLATPDILDLILSNGIDINTSSRREGHTCIFYALEMENKDKILPTIKLLLEKGADHTLVCSNGDTILHYAARKGRIDYLRFFLEVKNMNINQTNKEGDTPIFSAVRGWSFETVKFLLRRGADYKLLNSSRSNLLHYAVIHCQLECLELCLSLGGLDINQINYNGYTPLLCTVSKHEYFSCYFNTLEMMTLLVMKGADHTISNKNGNNILHLLAKGDYAKGFGPFLGLPSINVNVTNRDNNTPIHLVCENILRYDANSLLHTIEQLLSLGADIKAKNNEDDTPLHIFERQTLKYGERNEQLRKNESDFKIRCLLEGSRKLNKSPRDC